jgi:hypothetical protein
LVAACAGKGLWNLELDITGYQIRIPHSEIELIRAQNSKNRN